MYDVRTLFNPEHHQFLASKGSRYITWLGQGRSIDWAKDHNIHKLASNREYLYGVIHRLHSVLDVHVAIRYQNLKLLIIIIYIYISFSGIVCYHRWTVDVFEQWSQSFGRPLRMNNITYARAHATWRRFYSTSTRAFPSLTISLALDCVTDPSKAIII